MSNDMDKRAPTRPVDNKAVDLYKKLLEVMELENTALVKKNLDIVEHYLLQKSDILKELDELKTDDTWMGNPETHAELGKLLKKIIDLNETNTDAVRKLKNEINVEISGLHKSKSAHKAYNSQK